MNLFTGWYATGADGSFLSGPRKIKRVLHVVDHASIEVNIEAPWYYLYSGKPTISIDFSQSRGNQWLAEKLEAELGNYD